MAMVGNIFKCSYPGTSNTIKTFRMIELRSLLKPKKIIPLPKLTKKAQDIFNAWIRNRDKDACCITCGRYQIDHACHFYPAGQFSALRFDEDNVHGGCLQCNYYKHGNLNFYRMHILKRIGADKLAILDSVATRNRFHKWERFELEIIINHYKAA